MVMRREPPEHRADIKRPRGVGLAGDAQGARARVLRRAKRLAGLDLESSRSGLNSVFDRIRAVLLLVVALVLEACGGGSGEQPQPPPPAAPSDPEPTIDVPEEAAVDENSVGAVVASVSFTNAAQVTVNDVRFEIEGGSLKLKAGESLDFESGDSPLRLTVTAASGARSAQASVSVTIRDVNEAPAITVVDAKVAPGAPGAVAGWVQIQDPDAADADLGVADIAVNDDRFEVREDSDGTLRLALKQGVSLDERGGDSVELTVTVTDNAGLATSADVMVAITVPNRVPTISIESLFVPAVTPGALLGKILIEDPDPADIGLGGDDISIDDARFEVRLDEQGNLRLALKPGVSLQHSEADEVVRVVLTVTDRDGASATATAILVIAPRLPLGNDMVGRIDSADDRDWFAVTLEAGQSYRVDLEGRDTERGTLHDPHILGVYDALGFLLSGTSDDDAGVGANARTVFAPDEGGTYFVALSSAVEGTGTYTVSVDDYVDDFAASTSTSGALQVGASVSGEIELAADEDWFGVQLQAGRSYLIDLEGADTLGGDLADPLLRGIYDESGELLMATGNFDGGSGANSRVVFVVREDGTYFVSVSAEFGESGTYTLSVVEYLDDFSANSETDGSVSVGESVVGEIGEPGDQDWISVSLAAGKTYAIRIGGADSGSGSLRDPYIHGLYDATGTYLQGTLDDDGGFGLDSLLRFTPDDEGVFYICVGGALGATGTYGVSVEDEAEAENEPNADISPEETDQGWFESYWIAPDYGF